MICKGRMWDGWRWCACYRKAYDEDGFCRTHHPAKAAERKAKRDAKFEAKMQERTMRWEATVAKQDELERDAERYRKMRALAVEHPHALEAFVACNQLDYCNLAQFDDSVDSLLVTTNPDGSVLRTA